MNAKNYKIYSDSKELPLFNYERILETKDYFYMVKGYDQTQEITGIDPTDLENRFNEIVKHYIISMNIRNNEIINHGKAQKCYLEIARLESLYNIVVLKMKENELRQKVGLEIDNSDLKEALNFIKMPKSDDLQKQAQIIAEKIAKYQNDMEVLLAQIKKTPQEDTQQDINEMITNVELVLERTIDLEKTTLYRFGIMQEQALKKIEQITKTNEKYGR